MNITNFYFLVLDIETSKELRFDENLGKDMPYKVWLSYGVCKLVDIKGKIVDTLRFRKWSELNNYFRWIQNTFKKKVLCFIHNLSFEFDFIIKNLCKPKKFLCNSSHSVICADLEEYNIQLRCTYQLSKLSLAKIGEIYNLPKLEDDYCNIYPWETVSEQKWQYCERDTEILIPYVLDELNTYKMLCYIPYTSTGKVRKELKNNIAKDSEQDWDLMPPNDCFNALDKTFRGAVTMSNPRFTNVLINKTVKSFDEKSKYPSIMLCKEFPHTIKKENDFNNDTYKQHKFWLAKVEITGLHTKYDFGCLSVFNCENIEIYNSTVFNGKILHSPRFIIYICNVDLDIINTIYTYKHIEFIEFYTCEKYGKLPNCFIELIKTFARDKTEIGKQLKQVEKQYGENSDEYREINKQYMDAKAKLNSIYGMMVQKLTQPEFVVDENFLWHEVTKPYKYIEGKHLNRNFLYGIYITAYSRYDLVRNIVHNCPNNFVYCDTDSIKYIDIGKPFEDLNEDIPEYLQEFDYLKGFNKFEEELPYEQFLTYGAKKYAYIRNGEFSFTVAGLPKNTKINGFEEFYLGKVYEDCKLAKRYIYHNAYTDVDEFTNTTIRQFTVDDIDENFDNGGIALFDTSYKLDMTDMDKSYIEQHKDTWEYLNKEQGIL